MFTLAGGEVIRLTALDFAIKRPFMAGKGVPGARRPTYPAPERVHVWAWEMKRPLCLCLGGVARWQDMVTNRKGAFASIVGGELDVSNHF